MGFCILGGKETYLRKTLSDLLTSLGEAVGIGATPAEFSSAITDIYADRYTAGQDSLKVNRKLTLTASQIGTNEDITDNWYTSVNASAVYNAGQDAAKGPSTGLTVYNIANDDSGSTGISNSTKSKSLPAGTYNILIIMCGFYTSTPTITVKIGNQTRTYGSASQTSGSGTTYGSGNPLNFYWHDSFTLTSSTNVTITLSETGSNYRTRSALATIY